MINHEGRFKVHVVDELVATVSHGSHGVEHRNLVKVVACKDSSTGRIWLLIQDWQQGAPLEGHIIGTKEIVLRSGEAKPV